MLFGLELAFASAYLAPTLNPVDMLGQNGEARVRPTGANPVPKPAILAILRAFVHYEIVGMSEAHGQNDVDDFILTK
jgi:hypothetical protein